MAAGFAGGLDVEMEMKVEMEVEVEGNATRCPG
jgi:hypothetical protein